MTGLHSRQRQGMQRKSQRRGKESWDPRCRRPAACSLSSGTHTITHKLCRERFLLPPLSLPPPQHHSTSMHSASSDHIGFDAVSSPPALQPPWASSHPPSVPARHPPRASTTLLLQQPRGPWRGCTWSTLSRTLFHLSRLGSLFTSVPAPIDRLVAGVRALITTRAAGLRADRSVVRLDISSLSKRIA